MDMNNFTTAKSSLLLATIFSVAATTAVAQTPNYNETYLADSFSKSGSLKVKVVSNDSEYIQKSIEKKLSLAECPKYIKSTFSLNITDLAKLLHVSRPTSYKYINGEIPEDSVELIDNLYEVANLWDEKTNGKSIGMELKRNHDGNSLFKLLSEKKYDLANSYLVKIADLVNSRSSRTNDLSAKSKHNQFSPDMTRKMIRS